MFAMFSTVHGGCIRGSAGYGIYGIYGYGNRSNAVGRATLEPYEGECVASARQRGDDGCESYRSGDCDESDADGDDSAREPPAPGKP
jgi:hypothetical protein